MARQPDNKSADNSAANLKSDDSALIRELALLLDETSLTEIEIERAGLRVRVARNITVSAAMPAGYPADAGGGQQPSAAGADLAKHPARYPRRWSVPPIGRPSPAPSRSSRSAPGIGGQDLLIIEAMKTMRPDPIATRGHGDANSRRGRPAGRIGEPLVIIE